MSKEVTSPYFDVFEPNTIDRSITEFEYVEYQQRDASKMNTPDGVHTNDTHDKDVYFPIIPLHARGRLHGVTTDCDYTADYDLTLTNGGWSLFRTGHQINNNVVEEIDQYLSHASVIMNLARYSDDYSQSSGSNLALW